MFPADVAAAPAAAPRYQDTSSTPLAARRERPVPEADPFGELVDQLSDDAEPPTAGPLAASGHRAARPAVAQAVVAQPQAQALASDAPVAGSPPSVKSSQPLPDDVPPAVVAVRDATADGRADLIVPQLPTPFDRPLSVPVSASATGSDVAVTEDKAMAEGARMTSPLLPQHRFVRAHPLAHIGARGLQ